MNGHSFKCEKPFYVFFKKHYCPHCKNKLTRKTVSEIINSETADKTKYDFDVAEITVKGNMKFTHIEFYCNQCDKYYTIKEAKENNF